MIAIITVPWMLFVKPLILRKRNNLQHNKLPHNEEIELMDVRAKKNYNVFVEEKEEVS